MTIAERREDEASERRPPRGYTLVLPPGWQKIPLRSGTDKAITKILDRTFADLPRDQVATTRREVQQRLRALAEQAREQSGLDLYVPTERMGEVTATASFVVAEISLVSAEQIDPQMLVARLLADSDDTRPVEIADTAGARTEHVTAAEPDQEIEHASRRVDYVLPVPGDADRWVVVSFATLGMGDPRDEFADLLVELFDAVMTTFRWRQP